MTLADTEDKRTQIHVRHALEHLYDVDALSDHWLIARLNLTHAPARAGALQRCLIAAIQRMRPEPQESLDTPRWQMYQVLLQRYVQHTNADSLAYQLGMSSRNLRRIQNRAIAYLAEMLFQEKSSEPTPVDLLPAVENDSHLIARVKAVDEEIGWLRDAILSEPVSVEAVWAEAVQFFAPLAKSAAVQLEWSLANDLPKVVIHPFGLRQVLLSILNYLVEQAKAQTIVVSAPMATEQVQIVVSSMGNGVESAQTSSSPLSPSTPSPSLLLAQRILSIFGGYVVEKRRVDGHFDLQISLMTAGGTKILVIDDNLDILQLYHRYVTGTRYQLLVCDDPAQALAMAATHSPKLILLDIMMPGIDGWSLLGKLRHHPATASVPVIISTIVPERGLALALGADDFLKKPITRAVFLSALDRQVALPTPAYR